MIPEKSKGIKVGFFTFKILKDNSRVLDFADNFILGNIPTNRISLVKTKKIKSKRQVNIFLKSFKTLVREHGFKQSDEVDEFIANGIWICKVKFSEKALNATYIMTDELIQEAKLAGVNVIELPSITVVWDSKKRLA